MWPKMNSNCFEDIGPKNQLYYYNMVKVIFKKTGLSILQK